MFLPWAYYNGRYQDVDEIKFSVKDLAILRGYAIFDFFKLVELSNPWIGWYLKRLVHSCKQAGILLPVSTDEIYQVAKALLQKNGKTDGFIKIILTAGESSNGFTADNSPNLLITALPLSRPNLSLYENGATLLSSDFQRSMPDVKSINYLHAANIMSQTDTDAVDVLYYHEDIITEASRCNFYAVIKGSVMTPKNNILSGITRQRLLSLTGNKIMETDLKFSDLSKFEEVFISSTTKGIMPITQIDGLKIGEGQVGPVTQDMMHLINSF